MVRKIKEKKLIPLVNFTDYHNKLKSTHPADGKSVGEKGSISNILRCFYVLVLPMVDPIRETTYRFLDVQPAFCAKSGTQRRPVMSEIAWIDMTVAIEVLSRPESSVRTKGIIVLKFVSATKDTPIPVQKGGYYYWEINLCAIY